MENFKIQFKILLDLFKSRSDKAEMFCKELIKSNPQYAILYNIMGLIKSEQKRYDEAISFYNTGIKVQPDFAMIYNNLGSLYKLKQEYNKAENYYKKSINF